MKSLIQLHECLIQDLGQMCRVSTDRDLSTILVRVNQEGMSFLTITLPTFSKAFERALENRSWTSKDLTGFRLAKSSCLPAFLHGFTSLVFHSGSGLLRDDPNHLAILAVRQICLAFKKLEAPCSLPRERAALEQFILTDNQVDVNDSVRPSLLWEEFSHHAKVLFDPILYGLERDLARGWLIPTPKHGPGATAERLTSNGKYLLREWPKRLESAFHFEDFIPAYGSDLPAIDFVSPRNEKPVRVVTVPKTLKTPRVIGIEPACMQYVQQGLLELLVPLLESKGMFDSLGFTDQSPNQRLARTSSIDREFATLDLSEASDRVSNRLVQSLLHSYPTLGKMVQACRSHFADVPGYGVIHLAKFASMGSALCFPIEAMVFLTVVFMAYTKHSKQGLAVNERSSFLRSVRIYGDDIIVPTDMAQFVIDELADFGLLVNRNKSFWNGNFRESCGGDFFDGVDVKPLYVKRELPRSRRFTEEMESAVSFRNAAFLRGFARTVSFLDSQIERVAPFPFVSDKSPILGKLATDKFIRGPLCPDLHRVLAFGMIPKRKLPVDDLDGSGAMLKFFLKRGLEPIFAKDHLQRAGRPKSADLRLGWAPA